MIDSVLRVASPDGVAFDLHPAGPSARMTAFLLDSFLQGILMLIIFSILAAFNLTSSWIAPLIIFVIVWFYMVICELSLSGRSPGKMVLGLQVVLNDGSPITAGASLLRNLLRIADYFFGLGLIIPLCNPGFRRLGDLVGGTLVVYVPERLMRLRTPLDWQGIEARPPEHILEPNAAEAILAFARRRKDFSPQLCQELAKSAASVFLFDQDPETAEKACLGVAAWYAGERPKRRGKP